MARKQIGLSLDVETIAALDERAEREGLTRTELIEFAIEPLLKNGRVQVLPLAPAVIEMFDRIAAGQGFLNRIDVMARALNDYAGRAAERWQEHARQDQRPDLKLIADTIRSEHGIRPYEGN